MLAHYLGIEPARISLRTTPYGRPELAPPRHISFSLSQAGDLAVLAVARGRDVGVDIERLRPLEDVMDLAHGLFAREEVNLLDAADPRDRAALFLRLWTAKEAVVKAIGVGLSMALDSFSVPTQAGVGLGRPWDPHGTLPLVVAPLEGLPGHVGAVALAGSAVHVRYFEAREIHLC